MSNENNNLCTCGCCEGNEMMTPADIINFPGLSVLKYRIGTHAAFKQSMLAELATNSATAKLTTRNNDDLTIATLDAWAMVLDVLSFYQERIINEGFLRPATERLSILELAKHISYKLKPGVAASTYLAFTMNESLGTPVKAVLPIGTKVQSIPEQDQFPQVFETIEELEAKVEWSKIKLKTSERKIPQYDGKEIFLKGIVTGLQPGDGLLMIGSERENNAASERWDFRKIDKIIPDPLADITRVTWKRGLGKQKGNIQIKPAANDFKVFALRQRASLFGYNAPDFGTLSGTIKS